MKRLALGILLIAVLAAATAYNLHSRVPAAPPADPPVPGTTEQTVPVTIATARRRASRDTVSLTGTLRADQQATVSARAPGRIVSVFVRTGDHVRRGAVVVKLDATEAAAQASASQAGVAAADAQYRKAVDAKRAREVEADSQVSQADGALRTALGKLRQAELAVQLTDSSSRSDSERAAAAVRQAESGLRQAETSLAQATDGRKRAAFLFDHGGVARADVESAEAQERIARDQRDSAQAALDQARAAANPAAETGPLRKRLGAEDLEAARSGVTQAREALKSAYRGRTELLRIADRDIEAARAQADQARASSRGASAQAAAATAVSPLDGVVTDVGIHTGESVQGGQPLVTIVSPGSIYVEAAAPARFSARIRPGDAARVVVDSMPDLPLDGEVTEILPVASSEGRSIPVRIRLNSSGYRLAAGLGAKAEIDVLQEPDAVSIPVDALRNEGSVNFVYVVASGRAERRNVATGVVDGQYVQVLSGLRAGDAVILTGPASLQSGTPVQVVGRG